MIKIITVKFEVTQTEVKVIEKSDRLISGNKQQIKCLFNLSEEYNNLIVRAVFNGEYRTVVNGECFAPELNEGRCVIGVYGYLEQNGKTVKRISPAPCEEYVYKGSYSDRCREATATPPSELEEYYSAVKQLVDSGALKGDAGKNGIGIVASQINKNGELLLTYSDDQVKNVGKVVGPKGDKGEDAQLPGNLRRTMVVYSDEDLEGKYTEFMENLSSFPVNEVLFAYDATESLGVPLGGSLLILGNGNIDESILIPIAHCEEQYTEEQSQQIAAAYSFCSGYYSNHYDDTSWYPINDRSQTFVTMDHYESSYNKTFYEHKTRHLKFDASFRTEKCRVQIHCSNNEEIDLTSADYQTYADEEGFVLFHIDIQPCGGQRWLVECTAPNGIKTLHRTAQLGNDFIVSITFRQTGVSSAKDVVKITNAYGRSI